MSLQARVYKVQAVALRFTLLDRDRFFQPKLALQCRRLVVKLCNLVTVLFAWDHLYILKQLWTVTDEKTANLLSLAILICFIVDVLLASLDAPTE